RTYQAILPLRGKIINTEKNRINKVLSNNEVQAMITAIGTGIGDEFDIAKLRYHRVIVMTDADVDGSHIRTLILTFLYRQMRELIEQGHVYIAVPPLYKVKLGNQEFYFEKDAQLEELLARERIPNLTVTSRDGAEVKLTEAKWARVTKALREYEGWLSLDLAKEGIQLSRVKGLGEMNDTQLWDTTMDPARRLLIRVDVEDASAADRLFSMLMGDQVEPRRLFIEENAKDVRFLDV